MKVKVVDQSDNCTGHTLRQVFKSCTFQRTCQLGDGMLIVAHKGMQIQLPNLHFPENNENDGIILW